MINTISFKLIDSTVELSYKDARQLRRDLNKLFDAERRNKELLDVDSITMPKKKPIVPWPYEPLIDSLMPLSRKTLNERAFGSAVDMTPSDLFDEPMPKDEEC
jgi:hypothetical protein